MPIVKCQLPAGKTKVSYGGASLGVDTDGSVEIPKYVAKTLVAAGATCADPLTGSVASLLAGSTSSEQNYIFLAYDQPLGGDASALLAARGEPAVIFS